MLKLQAINCSQNNNTLLKYQDSIMLMTQNIHEIIAGNVERLMEYHKIEAQTELAKKTKISQRTISNILTPGSVGSLTTKTIEKLASYFNLEPYHLIIPDLPIEELLNKRLEKVIECYSQSTPEGRENIKRIAENEVRYSPPSSSTRSGT
jgi:transcriptional regulator with XRE-family HTH domain